MRLTKSGVLERRWDGGPARIVEGDGDGSERLGTNMFSPSPFRPRFPKLNDKAFSRRQRSFPSGFSLTPLRQSMYLLPNSPVRKRVGRLRKSTIRTSRGTIHKKSQEQNPQQHKVADRKTTNQGAADRDPGESVEESWPRRHNSTEVQDNNCVFAVKRAEPRRFRRSVYFGSSQVFCGLRALAPNRKVKFAALTTRNAIAEDPVRRSHRQRVPLL
jgi:hypothetical protein